MTHSSRSMNLKFIIPALVILIVVVIFASITFSEIESHNGIQATKSKMHSPLQTLQFIKTYFVDSKSGNDNNSGENEAHAWRSLLKVNSTTFAPGSRILFLRGDTFLGTLHPNGSGTNNHPIEIGAYGSGQLPLINSELSNSESAVFLYNQDNYIISNIRLTNTTQSANFGTLSAPGTPRYGILIEDNGAGVLSNIEITDVNVSNISGCFSCSKVDSHINGGIVVLALGSNDSFNEVRISNNSVTNVSRSGIVFWDQSYYLNNYYEVDKVALSTQIYITNNRISNISGDGIITLGSLNAVIDGNTVSKAAQRTLIGSSEPASVGIMTTRSIGTVISHNNVSGTLTQSTDGEGYDADLGSTDTIVEYNYSHDNEGGFLLMMGQFSNTLTVRYNLSVNDSFGGMKGVFTFDNSQQNSQIYNNSVFIPQSSPANIIYCQDCASLSQSTWSLINNLIVNYGTGNYDFPDSKMTTFQTNDFYGNHPPNEPKGSSELYVNPGLELKKGTNLATASLSSFTTSHKSLIYRQGTLLQDNGKIDFFGNPVSQTLKPTIGCDEPIK